MAPPPPSVAALRRGRPLATGARGAESCDATMLFFDELVSLICADRRSCRRVRERRALPACGWLAVAHAGRTETCGTSFRSHSSGETCRGLADGMSVPTARQWSRGRWHAALERRRDLPLLSTGRGDAEGVTQGRVLTRR